MPRADSQVSVEIDTGAESDPLQRPDPDEPFRILVAGGFGGRAGRASGPHTVDRDNFDDLLAWLTPEVTIELGGAPLSIEFRELDDFHPDRLFERLAPFQALRGLRRRLSDPATFAAAATEITPQPHDPPSELAHLSGAELLRRMTGETPPPRAGATPRSDWDRMLHAMVAPYAVAKPDPRQPELIAQIDAAIAGQMRTVLHHPAFQQLEANWRGLFFLTRRLETGEDLKIAVFDLPQKELSSDAGLAALSATLADDAWAVVAGLYYFAPQGEGTLLRLAGMARAARAPMVAGLAPDVVGLTSVFGELRRSPVAPWIGLALPRFLLRLPYGQATGATETFAFEEMPGPIGRMPEHERYLWGHPAIACAYLLGAAFTQHGWQMRPGMVASIEGLPAHVYQVDREPELKPCAEVLLTEQAAEMLLDRGFMPLASIKGADRVRLVRFQSVADPSTPLAGRWA